MSNFLLAPTSYRRKRGKKLASKRVFSSEKSPLAGVRGLSFEEALDAVLPPSSPPRTSVSIIGSNTGGQNLAARASSVPQSTGPLMTDGTGGVQDDDDYGPRAGSDSPLPRSINGRSKTVIHRFHNRWPVHWLIQFRLKVPGSFLSRCRIPLCLWLRLA